MQEKLILGDTWGCRDGLADLIFTTESGLPLNRDRLSVGMKEIENKIMNDGIEFEHITPHTFRQTFATRCIENDMQPQILKSILGHSTLSMTMDLYAHVLPDTKAAALQCISNIM